MSLEDELWCLHLTDEERAVAGEKLAKALNLKPNEQGLYSTAMGERNACGLFNDIKSMLFEFADEVARKNEAENRLDNVIYIYE
ncbi:MAG: hypothetical protein GY818_21130 [Planctomycetaceae bacterium]|nr:hypothetical protein [Planctomycetaceae bacterium]